MVKYYIETNNLEEKKTLVKMIFFEFSIFNCLRKLNTIYIYNLIKSVKHASNLYIISNATK